MYPVLHLGAIALYTFGLCAGVGALVAFFSYNRYYELHHIPVKVGLCLAIILPIGVAGSRLENALLYTNPAQPLLQRIATSGYTWFGGFVCAFLAALLLIRMHRWPLLATLDGVFAGAPGYAIGRVGCFLAGDGDYGQPTSLPWGISFPHGIVPTTARVHPTMLYIAVWELLLFASFWWLSSPKRTFTLPNGTVFAAYLIGTAAGRFAIESLSRNPKLSAGLTEAQWVSVGLLAVGLLVLAWKPARKPERSDGTGLLSPRW